MYIYTRIERGEPMWMLLPHMLDMRCPHVSVDKELFACVPGICACLLIFWTDGCVMCVSCYAHALARIIFCIVIFCCD